MCNIQCIFFPFIQSSQHVAEYNMLQLFHELMTRTEYVPPEETKEEKEPPKLTGP